MVLMTQLTLITRASAKEAGLNHYFTGKPCKYGHIDERHVTSKKCCTCACLHVIDWQKRNKEKVRARSRRSYANNKQTRTDRRAEYKIESPEKIKARNIVNNALRDKNLFKKPCEVCGEIKVEAHHEDYLKPLQVRWLCKQHHVEAHT